MHGGRRGRAAGAASPPDPQLEGANMLLHRNPSSRDFKSSGVWNLNGPRKLSTSVGRLPRRESPLEFPPHLLIHGGCGRQMPKERSLQCRIYIWASRLSPFIRLELK
ncbi:hypothetical protein EYF80_037224 [Liparis tanakae]|uniref:Uncharacterized protein n=1 Tax=Liparis tanakae TaxID=230148 RepID=A0A4Z2GH05_9TELE|nr:hypothetical protein EYF80_037224 [Liparis tanakae]